MKVGRYVFRLPDIGEGIAEAEIAAWHVKVGDTIEEDQALVDVMTEKATVDIASPVAGRVAAIHGEVGERLAVGSPLVEFEGGQGDAVPATPPRVEEPLPVSPPSAPEKPQPDKPQPEKPQPETTKPLASPVTRRRAKELGVKLESLTGTGPNGRIMTRDLDDFLARSGREEAPLPGGGAGISETKVIGLRRVIAERMEKASRIPHFSYIEEFDLTELEGLRRSLNDEAKEGRPKLTLLPFLMCALVKLIPDFPHFNAHYDEAAGVLRSHRAIHIGIATQTSEGLLVPVVRNAEALDLWDSARELRRVISAARHGKAKREELGGSTITLTSLGALGGIAATPIINHPEVAILGPNKLVERPMVMGGQVVVRTMMNLSASFDHRIIDGYDAARFIQALKRLLERPALLFINEK
jgi:2-oxoisovalerate dehydrogenase E2 component (dihydrolipoyl transacylase)